MAVFTLNFDLDLWTDGTNSEHLFQISWKSDLHFSRNDNDFH